MKVRMAIYLLVFSIVASGQQYSNNHEFSKIRDILTKQRNEKTWVEDTIANNEVISRERPFETMLLSTSNGYVHAVVDEATGEFSQGADPTGGGDYYKMTYAYPSAPGTGSITFYIDGNIDRTQMTFPHASSYSASGDTVYSIWNNWNGAYIRQEITSVSLGATSGQNEQIMHKIVMKPADSGCHSVGCMVFQDVSIGSDDVSHIWTEFGYTGMAAYFLAPTMPFSWKLAGSYPPVPGAIKGLGVLRGFEATMPDLFWFGNWSTAYDFGWGDAQWLAAVGGAITDGAVMIKWYPRDVCEGDSAVFITYYGIGDYDGLGINFHIDHVPPILEADCAIIYDNPFTVSAVIYNLDSLSATYASAEIDISGLPLILSEGDNPQMLGDISGFGGFTTAIWELEIQPSAYGTIQCYDITVESDGGGFETANFCIDIPDLIEVSVAASAEFPVICLGSCVSLFADIDGPDEEFLSIEWTPSAGLSDPNIADPITCPTVTTIYSVRVSDTRNPDVCWDTSSVTIAVNTCEHDCTVEITPPEPLCCGDSTYLELLIAGDCPFETVSVQWTVEDSVISTGSTGIWVKPTSATEYRATISLDCGEGIFELSATATVEMVDWNLRIVQNDTTIFYEDSLLLSAEVAEECEPLDYKWRFVSGNVDIVFVIDSTGSMGFVIASVRSTISHLVNTLDSLDFDYRFGGVTFGDGYNVWDFDPSTPGAQMTSDADEFRGLEGLAHVGASGGGDGPEQSLDAIAAAIYNYDWRDGARRIIIGFTDAPYCQRDDECTSFCNPGGGAFASPADYADFEVAALIESTETVITWVSPDIVYSDCATFTSPIPDSPYEGSGHVGWYQYFCYVSGGRWYLLDTANWLTIYDEVIDNSIYINSQEISVFPTISDVITVYVENPHNPLLCKDSVSINVSVLRGSVISTPDSVDDEPVWLPDTIENRGDFAFTGISKFIKLINAFRDTIQIGLSVDDNETFWKLATNVGDTVRPLDSTLCYYNCYSISAVFSDWEPAAGLFDNPLNLIQPDSLNWMSDSTFGGTIFIEPHDSIYLWLRIGTPPWFSVAEEVIKLRISHRIWGE